MNCTVLCIKAKGINLLHKHKFKAYKKLFINNKLVN